MKILVIQDRLRSGGTERQSILLTRAFLAAGHDAKLLTFRPGGELAASAADLPRIVLQWFDTHLDWFAPGIFRQVTKFAPDIILCMGRMANCNAGSLQNLMQAKFPRSAIVCTMRTGKPLPALYRHSIHRVRHVIANSHQSAKILTENYVLPAEKITVIHNSLVFAPKNDSATTTTDRTALRARFNATDKTVVLLCVAMFRPEKNQGELIELAAQLPRERDWQLWLTGEGPARAECEALVTTKNLGERVKFTGLQTDPRPFYHAADLAVLTSRSESLPNFLIEAHAHGLPSVAYDVGGVTECGGVVVSPGDQPAFLNALRPLLTDETLRAKTSAEVRAYTAAHFAPERQSTAHLELFERLLGIEKTDSLSDSLHEEIKKLCAKGDELAGRGTYAEALTLYWSAWDKLPAPKTKWNAATWILAAIGDADFLRADFIAGRDNLSLAMQCPGAIGNPFLHLRLGQCQFEVGNLNSAADELIRAYMGGGAEIFTNDDRKYLRFLASRAKNIKISPS